MDGAARIVKYAKLLGHILRVEYAKLFQAQDY